MQRHQLEKKPVMVFLRDLICISRKSNIFSFLAADWIFYDFEAHAPYVKFFLILFAFSEILPGCTILLVKIEIVKSHRMRTLKKDFFCQKVGASATA